MFARAAPTPPLLVSPAEAGRLLGVSAKTIQRLTRRGELPVVTVGTLPRYAVSDLSAWIESHRAVAMTTGASR